ncbi:hypothetical protein MMC25_007348 [Agyrium rufum]|nr:hypothetical protein [Agyrium rufum]
MLSSSSRTSTLSVLSVFLAFFSLVSAHTVITYPGWRGDNLHTNGTDDDFTASGGLGMGPNNSFPYGMQWMYPCGGMPLTQNRTLWPVQGGAISIQPGWFQGHATAFFYVNLGQGTLPINMSLPMVSPFQIIGPTKEAYPGQFCLPHVSLPAGVTAEVGQNATIQVVETAVHGAALYSCVDITFANPEDVEQVTLDNCFNSSDIGFDIVFTASSLTAGGMATRPATWAAIVPFVAALLWGLA